MQMLTVLGSTGSIGVNTLDVVRRWKHRYGIYALVAGTNVSLLAGQIAEFEPKLAVVKDEETRQRLVAELKRLALPAGKWPQLEHGAAARVQAAIAPEVEFVLSAIVGVAGLEATFEAIRLGKRIGLANKEVLVSGGELVMAAVREFGSELLPVDSEHNGAHQCLRAGKRAEAVKLILTASGGPFRKTPKEEFARVTPAQALNHPTWKMGPRITIDSATLMNKGFEVIEACWLFDFTADEVEVVVHPQSKVHAMVEFNDGSVITQVCATDMRMPIQYALTYPERADAPVPKLRWDETHSWEFHPPDWEKFPLLGLAYQAIRAGGSAGCTLNAADEIAVEAFLEEQIPFPYVSDIVAETLDRMGVSHPQSIGELLDVDLRSRRMARELVAERAVRA
ncbi:1-deoxy-D-xylulose-5-phosphate reductoisomerase [Bryobacter aggregatus]|uniref:1-deoxy-D-xylulose-5-phosphate reductoisomerase n=1 Tax=Bryobacter aggregatus TaxID=360054 RepID=UPI0004E22DF7|nr:1-deoxy-D-xylulose-5-phosphate reductoisomerase [Bryobacter aggregatus]